MRLSQISTLPTKGRAFIGLVELFLLFALTLPGHAQSALTPVSYFPLIFSAEGEPLRTTACINMRMRATSGETWWRQGGSKPSSPADAALVQVMEAIVRQNNSMLLSLSHRRLGQDERKFDEQANALFSQVASMGMGTVQYAFSIDDLTVYYLKFQSQGKELLVPFMFALDKDGAWRYLPYRTQSVTFDLLHEWIRSRYGPESKAEAALCTAADVAKLKLAIPLDGQVSSGGVTRSFLHLNGGVVTGNLPVGAGSRALNAMSKLGRSMSAGNLPEYAAGLTKVGRERFLKWYESAPEAERLPARLAMKNIKPIAYFDISPVSVVVVASPEGRKEAAYFIAAGLEMPLMVNSSHIINLDEVFKRQSGPVLSFKGDVATQMQKWARER